MVKISSIFGLGVFVALIQFLGLPFAWKNMLYFVSGVSIVALAWLIRKELHEVVKYIHSDTVHKTDTYAESTPKVVDAIVNNENNTKG